MQGGVLCAPCRPPKEAWQLIQDDPRAVLVDIRSTMEYLFVGHPSGALHVAWIDEPEWTVNPHFVTDVRKVMLGGATAHGEIAGAPVILICRSGKRSLHHAPCSSRPKPRRTPPASNSCPDAL